jgi:Protein of unknown function (DUF4065)
VADLMEADEAKLAELILYVAERILQDPSGGAIKINKILYFAEFSHVRAHGTPITGATYQKLRTGPAPRRLLPIRQQLIDDGFAGLRIDQHFGYPLHRLIPLRSPDLSSFVPTELSMADEVVRDLWGKTAAETSRESHKDMAWKLFEEGEDIPFATAYLARKVLPPTERVRRRGAELVAQLGTGG